MELELDCVMAKSSQMTADLVTWISISPALVPFKGLLPRGSILVTVWCEPLSAWAHPGEMVTPCLVCSYILYSLPSSAPCSCTLELCWGNFKLVNFAGSFCWESWFSVPRFWCLPCTRGVAAFAGVLRCEILRRRSAGECVTWAGRKVLWE